MPVYRIHRLKETARQSFRNSPHTAGAAAVKPRDYQEGGVLEAATVYGAWTASQSAEAPLLVGDLLESPDGTLWIYKYVGFERADWVLPEVKSGLEEMPGAVGQEVPPVTTA